MKIIATDTAPAAVGPYSQAVVAGGTVYCSGQLGLVKETMKMAGDDVETQAKQVLANMEAVLKAAGSSKDKVVKCTMFLQDMAAFPKVNPIYEAFFEGHKPARSTIQVAGLPLGALVEIECIALAG